MDKLGMSSSSSCSELHHSAPSPDGPAVNRLRCVKLHLVLPFVTDAIGMFVSLREVKGQSSCSRVKVGDVLLPCESVYFKLKNDTE